MKPILAKFICLFVTHYLVEPNKISVVSLRNEW